MYPQELVRKILLLCAFASLIVGVIGIFVPLLPTTPFLILAAFCFDKSSKKFHSWLLNHKYLGPPIQDWQKKHVIRVPYKLLATFIMLVSWIVVMQKTTVPLLGKWALSLCLLVTGIFIWTRNSKYTD